MHTAAAAQRLSGVLLVALLAACGGSSDSTGPHAGGNPITGGNTGNNDPYGGNGGNTNNAPNTVVIAGSAFAPETLAVAVGARVMFQNNDAVVHTATADGGSFDTSDIASGTSVAAVFGVAGVYAYHCAIHPTMHGVIKVQ